MTLADLEREKRWTGYDLVPDPTPTDPNHKKKVPYHYVGKEKTYNDWQNPENWTTRDELGSRELHGICRVPGDSLIWIDFDGCWSDGVLHPEVRALLDKHPLVHVTRSASGDLHVVGRIPGPGHHDKPFDLNIVDGKPIAGYLSNNFLAFRPEDIYRAGDLGFDLTGFVQEIFNLYDPTKTFREKKARAKKTKNPLPDEIPDGERNDLLFKEACRHRREGKKEREILGILRVLNQERCKPPVSDTELETIAKSASKFDPVSDTFKCTESGDAEFFTMLYGDRLRYDYARDRWLLFNGHLWIPQKDGETDRLALDSIRLRQLAAVGDQGRLDWAAKGEARKRQTNLLALARSMKPIADSGENWDSDLNLLGVPNGVVDLRTGLLRPGHHEDQITKTTSSPWNPDARSELFESVLLRALPDPEVQDFLQTLAGLTIAGLAIENVLPLIFGVTRSSKGTILDAIKTSLGDYSRTADLSTLARRAFNDGSAARPDLIDLVGSRMVAIFEAGRRFKLDTALVKTLTGSDPIKARTLYEKPIEFRPAFLIWLATDTRPEAPSDDDAFYERLCEIPFNEYLKKEDQNPEVRLKLKEPEHGSAILSWAYQGLKKYRKDGRLIRPDAVRKANTEFRNAMEPHKEYFDTCVSFGDEKTWTPAEELRRDYEKWCREIGDTAMNGNQFGDALTKRGAERSRKNIGRGWARVKIDPEVF